MMSCLIKHAVVEAQRVQILLDFTVRDECHCIFLTCCGARAHVCSFTSPGARRTFFSRTRRLRWVDSLVACNPVDRVVISIKLVLGIPHCSSDLSLHFLRDASSPTVMGV